MLERFEAKVEKLADGCWKWLGYTMPSGYGKFRLNQPRKMEYAHRVAYELFVGPIPEGLTIDHLCRNRACVNPEHLEAVTHRENVLRGVALSAVFARRSHCKHGHELTEENIYMWRNARYCRTCRRLRHAAKSRRVAPDGQRDPS